MEVYEGDLSPAVDFLRLAIISIVEYPIMMMMISRSNRVVPRPGGCTSHSKTLAAALVLRAAPRARTKCLPDARSSGHLTAGSAQVKHLSHRRRSGSYRLFPCSSKKQTIVTDPATMKRLYCSWRETRHKGWLFQLGYNPFACNTVYSYSDNHYGSLFPTNSENVSRFDNYLYKWFWKRFIMTSPGSGRRKKGDCLRF